MLIDFIGTFAAGFAAAGVVMLLNRLLGRIFPKWVLPVAAGATMIAFTIYREYTWFPTVRAQLPPEVIIVAAPKERMLYRPWTYVAPITLRFLAVDKIGMLRSTADPDLRVVNLVGMQRWAATQGVKVAFDCGEGRMAPLVEGAELGEDGQLIGADWQAVGPDDPYLKAACDGG
ncbi:hypothetical protein [Ostreiculturibacter nitratireducens]|uniref:hypothetical protein n=1 Tax=Ostreiculturibacter nitratireducens TaxID=3075226 RepID=UPI0031B63982